MDEIKQSDVELSLQLEFARLQLEIRQNPGLRAYMASVQLGDDDPVDTQESLQELGALVRSLGDECLGALVQKRDKAVPATFIGSGKALEVADNCRALRANYIVFDQELSPSQVRNLEKLTGFPVLDRAGLILQIFRKNAKSREAKTQVEIAHLEYLAPRVSNAWVTFERQRGGSGTRTKGAGETQLELDKRKIRDKIIWLKKDLLKIQKEREAQRKSRKEEVNVVFVGYTNAGKTTLMNQLTQSQLSAKDALFETLDSAVRELKGVQNPKILLTDTVGFIRNLPHGLVASFRSTLEETRTADLLLHVVDISHSKYKEHIKVTNDVLREVGAGNIPKIMVFNKIDALIGEPNLKKFLMRSYEGSITLSAADTVGVEVLKDKIVQTVTQDMIETFVHVDYSNADKLSLVYKHARILDTQWGETVASFKVRLTKVLFERHFSSQTLKDEDDAV